MANLEIKIGAKDTGVSAALGKIRSSLGSFSSGFSSIWGKLAGAITAGAVLAKAKSTAAALDDLKDRAENLAMPTDELQRWSFAAEDAGLGAEKFGIALNAMNNVIQDSGKGGAAGLAAIEKLAGLNIDPAQLKGKSFSDQMGLIFDSLAKMEDKEKALAAAGEIFGTKTGKYILGLAANWRTLKGEVSGEKIFTAEDIKAGEDFTKTLAQLDITIQKLVTGSGLLQWLTKIGVAMDKVYSATPTKADYGSSANVSTDRDVAISALTKTGKYTKRENTGSFFLPNYQNVTNIPEKDIADYMAKNMPDSAGKKARIDAQEKINAENKLKAAIEQRAAAEKKADEQNLADTLNRLQANQDVQKLAELTGKSGVTQEDIDRLKSVSSVKDRFEVEQQITAEKKKQIDLAKEEQKKVDAENDAKKSIADTIASLEEKRKEQDLINAGKSKEAAIQAELTRAAKEAKRELSADEAAKISNATAALYDAEQAKNFKGAQGAIVNDRFSAVGGMGGKMFSQDNTPKLHLAVAQQTQKAVATIQQGVMSIAANSGNSALRAP